MTWRHGAVVRLKMSHAPMFSQKYSELLGALSLVDWKKSGTGKFKLFFSMGLTFVCFKTEALRLQEKTTDFVFVDQLQLLTILYFGRNDGHKSSTTAFDSD